MSTGISPDNEDFIRQALAEGRFQNREQILNAGVRMLREAEATIDAIQEGLDSVDRGEGVPLEEADKMLRDKHKIPWDA